MRIKSTILLSFLAITINSCFQQPTVNYEIEDNNSKLLSVVMTENDFIENIDWDLKQITQRYEIPTNENYLLVETSSSGLIGSLNDTQPIIISHKLSRYEKSVDWKLSLQLIPEQGYQLVNVTVPDLGKDFLYQCYSDYALVICEFSTRYDKMVSTLLLQGPLALLENNKIELIEQALLRINERVSHYYNE